MNKTYEVNLMVSAVIAVKVSADSYADAVEKVRGRNTGWVIENMEELMDFNTPVLVGVHDGRWLPKQEAFDVVKD